jgi:hypothetical protein
MNAGFGRGCCRRCRASRRWGSQVVALGRVGSRWATMGWLAGGQVVEGGLELGFIPELQTLRACFVASPPFTFHHGCMDVCMAAAVSRQVPRDAVTRLLLRSLQGEQCDRDGDVRCSTNCVIVSCRSLVARSWLVAGGAWCWTRGTREPGLESDNSPIANSCVAAITQLICFAYLLSFLVS